MLGCADGKTETAWRQTESGIGVQWVAIAVTNGSGSHSALAQGLTASHLERLFLQTSFLPQWLKSTLISQGGLSYKEGFPKPVSLSPAGAS